MTAGRLYRVLALSSQTRRGHCRTAAGDGSAQSQVLVIQPQVPGRWQACEGPRFSG